MIALFVKRRASRRVESIRLEKAEFSTKSRGQTMQMIAMDASGIFSRRMRTSASGAKPTFGTVRFRSKRAEAAGQTSKNPSWLPNKGTARDAVRRVIVSDLEPAQQNCTCPLDRALGWRPKLNVSRPFRERSLTQTVPARREQLIPRPAIWRGPLHRSAVTSCRTREASSK